MPSITILGATGRIGHAAALAFSAAGWTVTSFGRSNRKPINGMTFVAGDVRSGSMKRVASASGEGASSLPLIHAHLAALRAREFGGE